MRIPGSSEYKLIQSPTIGKTDEFPSYQTIDLPEQLAESDQAFNEKQVSWKISVKSTMTDIRGIKFKSSFDSAYAD